MALEEGGVTALQTDTQTRVGPGVKWRTGLEF